ncbi:hypothetical protein RO3G_02516 [Rhizopus delemar RA 99-880]|uniref:Uncharacterized protein n=1 Tax=Rhizopus delemar (strain RA 99-880 / ATCC MYA-4621 / FGSC 9543 / NRRL 43880) TaxID=246409 RepID=I1BNN2_RHIO9|nr:hypothetical protein RO3G_02516 [Rhizopus delemar RA 99-880]|eukprot:EIE77812.1 hypothetical protein RO3G_02516 [Rhizopus delemar RA 99-880]
MKLAVYLTLLFAAVIMMATAAPHNKSCHRLKDPHANAVCECGLQGICICKKTKISTKVSKSSK